MANDDINMILARRDMVERQLRDRGISDQRILAAFQDIPRELFIPPGRMSEVYEDHPVPIGYNQTISQPYVVALMTQLLDMQPHHRVLDIGAGSGYQAARLAKLAAHIWAIERIPELASRASKTLKELGIANVSIIVGDGSMGYAEATPYDRIISAAAGPEVPQAWIDQLADGGRIIAPVGAIDVQSLVEVTKNGGDIRQRNLGAVRFVRLIGKHGWSEENNF